jgi:hypothetical protein
MVVVLSVVAMAAAALARLATPAVDMATCLVREPIFASAISGLYD